MTVKPMCPAMRDASRGVQGGCRLAAKKKFDGACCAEHLTLLQEWTPDLVPVYKGLLIASKADLSGTLTGRMKEYRSLLLVTQHNKMQVKAAEQFAAQEETLLAAAEGARQARKAAECSPAAMAIQARKRQLQASLEEEMEEERPTRRMRAWRIKAGRGVGAESSAEESDGVGSEEEEEEAEDDPLAGEGDAGYGAGAMDNSLQYGEEIET